MPCICNWVFSEIYIEDIILPLLTNSDHPTPHFDYCIYAAKIGAASPESLSLANLDILPASLLSASFKNEVTQLLTSVISGQPSRGSRLIVVSCVKPTPKLISSGSCSTIVSSTEVGIGGFSRSLSNASQVKVQPFLYLSANAWESVRIFVSEMTAVLRSRGRRSFPVSGRMIFR